MKRIVTSGMVLVWSMPAAAQAKQAPPTAPTLCQEYVELAGDFAGIAKWFLVAALGLGVIYAGVQAIKMSREPLKDPKAGDRTERSTIKEVVDALSAFVEAMSKASVWLALFACGLLLFWFAGDMVPTACGDEMKKPHWERPSS